MTNNLVVKNIYLILQKFKIIINNKTNMDKIIRHSPEILEFTTDKKQFTIYWISDLHYDSKHSTWNKVKQVLDEDPNSYIIIGGDSLDVMQFVNDKRGTKSSTKPEHSYTDYANKIIEDIRKEVVIPYKNRIISWNRGNHDNSIICHHNIDLLQLICGVDIPIHEYSGYILLNVVDQNKCGRTNLIHFSHSPYSGGARSKGSLSIDIAKAEHPDADIWITEHIHNGFIHPVRHEKFSPSSKTLTHENKWYIQNIAAKQETEGPRNGFHFETMKGNRVSGIVRLNFKLNNHPYKLVCKEVNHVIF